MRLSMLSASSELGLCPSRSRVAPRRKSGSTVPIHPDDRLALGPFGRVEGGGDIVEGRDVADVRPQPNDPIRELADRVSAEGGDPSAVLCIVDDIELPAGRTSLRPILSRAAMSATLFSSRVAASASN